MSKILISYLLIIGTGGVFAYNIVEPADRQGLVLFVLCWLLLLLISACVKRMISLIDFLAALYSKERLTAKVKYDNPIMQSLIALLYLLTGWLLWELLQPDSIVKASVFILSWLCIAVLETNLFMKTEKRL
jgi:hypothetical protein